MQHGPHDNNATFNIDSSWQHTKCTSADRNWPLAELIIFLFLGFIFFFYVQGSEGYANDAN